MSFIGNPDCLVRLSEDHTMKFGMIKAVVHIKSELSETGIISIISELNTIIYIDEKNIPKGKTVRKHFEDLRNMLETGKFWWELEKDNDI